VQLEEYMAETTSAGRPGRRGAEWLATTSLLALSFYLLVVVFLGADVLGVVLNLKIILALMVVLAFALRFGFRKIVDRGLVSSGTILDISLLTAVLLTCMIVLDLVASAYLDLTVPEVDEEILSITDRNAWIGEWYPRTYFPTRRNFQLHKPNFTIAGEHYGIFYRPSMLDSPTLVDSVLDRRAVSIHIDELGFRERSPIDSCEIFTLGDSFTFGWGVTDGSTWPDLLERHLGTCVYNLGIQDGSPRQELLLLEHLLSRVGRRAAPRRLIWMIYEGNDLEDSYAELRPTPEQGTLERATRSTILAPLRGALYRLRTQSLIHRLRTGEIRLMSPTRRKQYSSAYTIDGVKLVTPLFHSPTLGFMLAHPPLLEAASRSESDILEHPNRAEVDKVFRRMSQLADSLGFSVTVAIVPTAVRVYDRFFSWDPAPSSEPYFIDYVQKLARAEGFDTIDLLEAFQPYASTEMLYFRDDDHLNPRGSEVTAGIISQHLAKVGR
jgi:lysophospholipase L1-like esterase